MVDFHIKGKLKASFFILILPSPSLFCSMIQFPCGVCGRSVGVRHGAIECDICKTWVHIKCNKFNKSDYKLYQNNPDTPFYCIICTAENIPFSTLNNNQFNVAVIKGINNILETEVQFSRSPTEQQIFDKINNAINSNAFDLNENAEDDCTINCNYYSIEEFLSAKFNSSKSFSILHLNIHSIDRHIEEFRIILEMLDFKFDIICLSESKIQKDHEPKVDININGYQTPVGTPTESSKGGVLIYIC